MNKLFTVLDFKRSKIERKKITMLTAYDYTMSKILDESGIDCILVGDSLGMVVLGYEDTTKVTMNDMLHHIKAVTRGAMRALVIGDMPFLSYNIGKYESVKNAGRLIAEGGCRAVKLEGGEEVIDDIKAIINAGIPVMGHLGYTPQSINMFGGHKAQGKTLDTARKIFKDALLLQQAGVFGIVLECIPYKLAELISSTIDIPTIGIGSGAGCDGQVLVTPDIIGVYKDFSPKHSKRYIDMYTEVKNSVKKYIEEVESRSFPLNENSYKVDHSIIKELEEEYQYEENN